MATKVINGERVTLTAQEEADLLAEELSYAVPDAKATMVKKIKKLAITKMNSRISGIRDINQINIIEQFWLSIAPAARQPTSDFQYIIDVRQAAIAAIVTVNAMNDKTTIDNYDVDNAPSWPT